MRDARQGVLRARGRAGRAGCGEDAEEGPGRIRVAHSAVCGLAARVRAREHAGAREHMMNHAYTQHSTTE